MPGVGCRGVLCILFQEEASIPFHVEEETQSNLVSRGLPCADNGSVNPLESGNGVSRFSR
jgi:hypothetical protein